MSPSSSLRHHYHHSHLPPPHLLILVSLLRTSSFLSPSSSPHHSHLPLPHLIILISLFITSSFLSPFSSSFCFQSSVQSRDDDIKSLNDKLTSERKRNKHSIVNIFRELSEMGNILGSKSDDRLQVTILSIQLVIR